VKYSILLKLEKGKRVDYNLGRTGLYNIKIIIPCLLHMNISIEMSSQKYDSEKAVSVSFWGKRKVASVSEVSTCECAILYTQYKPM
jgi:hypothetical protein